MNCRQILSARITLCVLIIFSLIFYVAQGSLAPLFGLHLVAGVLGFMIFAGHNLANKWSLATTATFTVFVLFGFVGLAVLSRTRIHCAQ